MLYQLLVQIIVINLSIEVPYPLPNQQKYSWDFNTEGNSNSKEGLIGHLINGAKVENGNLVVSGGGFMRTEPIDNDTVNHTLLASVQLDNLSQQGGGVVSIQRIDINQFNGIVYGERKRQEWMFGSENSQRWSPNQSNGRQENQANQKYVYVAFTYKKEGCDYRIKLFHNGDKIDEYTKPDSKQPHPWEGGETDMIFGIRQYLVGFCYQCDLSGKITEVYFFQQALSNDDIEKFQHQRTVCFNECKTCQDGYGCIECQDTSKHLPDCSHDIEGWFIESVNPNTYRRNYQKCHNSCKTCNGSNANNCLSCYTELSYNRKPLSVGRCDCQLGYFDDNTNKACQQCDISCQTCTGSTSADCNTCSDTYYKDYDGVCKKCQRPCINCSSATQCTSCLQETSRKLENNCKCDDGYFENDQLVCEHCNYGCSKCSGSKQNCQQCIEVTRNVNNGCQCQKGYYEIIF